MIKNMSNIKPAKLGGFVLLFNIYKEVSHYLKE